MIPLWSQHLLRQVCPFHEVVLRLSWFSLYPKPCTHIHTHTNTHVYPHIFMHTYKHTYTLVHTHIPTCTGIHIYTGIHT